MTATNEAWISDSLARLEHLERQREQLAATGQTERLAELEEEIKSLYEVLEAAADDGDTPANSAHAQAAAAPAWTPPAAVASAPQPPFGPPPQAFAPPAQSFAPPAQSFAPPAQAFAPAAAPGFAPAPMSSSSDDDDIRGGSKAPLVIGLVAVVGAIGAAAWFFVFAQPKPVEQPSAPAGTPTVIQAGAIPDDTQDPNVAKGGDASRTPAVTIKEPAPDDRRPVSRPSSGGNTAGPSRPSRPEKTDSRSGIKVDHSDDPLAGVK